MTIRIVTDSTSDLTPEAAAELGITVVPLTVTFNETTYLDNIDLDNTTFYQKLVESKDLPQTSQPSPALFQEAYTRLIEEGADAILSVHLASALSGTYQSACTARDSLPEELRQIPIEIIDSKNVSYAIASNLKIAVKEIQQGLGLAEIKEHLLERLARTHILAVLDTLEYVRRGGRIGAAKAMLGNMLSVKPIITLKDGAIAPLEQPRTRSKAFARVVQLACEKPLEEISIVEADEEVGTQLGKVLSERYAQPVEHYKLGTVLGTHAGPGTVGIIIVTAKE
jgi:DegV family protein with EDD domain